MANNERFSTGIVETGIIEAVKDGRVFRIFSRGDILTATSKEFLFRTTATPNKVTILRDVIIAASDSPLDMDIIALPTITDEGTSLPTFNLDLSSTRTSGAAAFEDPSFSGGVIMDQDIIPSGSTGGVNASGGARAFSEVIRVVPPDASFILKLQNTGAQTSHYIFKLVWE